MNSEKKLKGSISVGKVSGYDRNFVSIELTDELSRAVVVRVDLDLEQAARAILFSHTEPCEYILPGADVAGMKRIHETLKIRVPDEVKDVDARRQYVRDELREAINEGWDVHFDDITNHHRWTGGTCSVHVTKLVDPESEEAIQWDAKQKAKENHGVARMRAKGKKKGK